MPSRCPALALLLASALLVPGLAAQTPAPPKRPPIRQPVTPELERTAFLDARARTLLERARAARIAQDSSIRAYDAKTYQRISAGVGFRRLGRQRLLWRTEQAARVRWSRDAGIWVEPTGQRAAFSLGGTDLDMAAAAPIPYFPGKESLWIPESEMGVVRSEVDERQFLHPLATGAEAYYKYATGDSANIQLPDGRRIALRELRITARRPEWRAFVGSFWFDVDRGSLVRAAYRLAADIDMWQSAKEEWARDIRDSLAKLDSLGAADSIRKKIEPKLGDIIGQKIGESIFSPARASLSAITVEYGLVEGRFWLPKLNVAEGEMQMGPIRLPMKLEEKYTYESVNASLPLPVVPPPARVALAAGDTTTTDTTEVTATGTVQIGGGSNAYARRDTSYAGRVARADTLVRRYTARIDTLRRRADSLRTTGDTAGAREALRQSESWAAIIRQINRRLGECANGDSTYYTGTTDRYDGAVRIGIRQSCNRARLAVSADLPGSIYDAGEEVFGGAERDALLEALDFSLQPDWAPQRPHFHTGLDLLRYNRIEGLSLGGSATMALGMGYRAQAVARIGTGDRVPNGELSLGRSNGRTDLRVAGYHRLGVANDDWGAPLSFGASLSNLLFARDEGFYYRAVGAELAGTRATPVGGATLLWRVFAERQRSAGRAPNTQASLANLFGDITFKGNIGAVPLTAFGAGAELARSFGADPRALRLDARLRGEGSFTDRADSIGASGYGRLTLDATLARPLGPLALGLTGAGGGSAGDLPIQRAFFVGGLQTVRGQFARAEGEGRVGDAFWLGRAELGWGRSVAFRPSLFYDVGWAGSRTDFSRSGRPLSGAGIGLSLLDGLVRLDLARGIHPGKQWRGDVYLEARF